jgi:hypothetical protein
MIVRKEMTESLAVATVLTAPHVMRRRGDNYNCEGTVAPLP